MNPGSVPFREDLEEVRDAADRAGALTRQLLAFSHQHPRAPQVLDLRETIKGVERMLRRIIGEDVDFQTIVANELGRVRMDPGQLEQVIVNLVVNARDAINKGERITFRARNVELDQWSRPDIVDLGLTPGNYIELSVEDTGAGIDPKDIDRIFDPFFTTKEPGRGLGLSTVFGIVRQSGGQTTVESLLGSGTTFRVFIPREFEAASQAPVLDTDRPMGRGEKILLVEDDAVVRRFTSKTLQDLGYRVLVTASPGAAINTVQSLPEPFDLLLTDFVMPEMNGMELWHELERLQPNLRVLVFSGYSGDALRQGGGLEGVEFIAKPFTSNQLAYRLRAILDQPFGNSGDDPTENSRNDPSGH